jgi:hypothetical protein
MSGKTRVVESSIAIGPDRIMPVPKGRTIQNIALNAQISALDDSVTKLIRMWMFLESLPPGEMLEEARQISGYALMVVERQPLTEAARDQLASTSSRPRS